MLELDNFEEMEELEELEEGHVELLTENVSESDDIASLDDDMATLNRSASSLNSDVCTMPLYTAM